MSQYLTLDFCNTNKPQSAFTKKSFVTQPHHTFTQQSNERTTTFSILYPHLLFLLFIIFHFNMKRTKTKQN